ncbi:MAG: N-acetyl-gamma-glutamyl-phosphate reductase, partial [Armatimonadetes bacterium]|nr:N-acetyl-gamma-glutamyl-phosphate reductase [Armatimonadota bacterium]
VYPHLAGVDLPLQKLDPQAAAECDFALLAVPAGLAMGLVPALLEAGTRIIDVSPDFRLRQASLYSHWYKQTHACPELLQEAAFGIPEWNRDSVTSARLVAVPGCFTTGALLALSPLVRDGLIETGDIVVDGKTGLSGAGRTSLKLPYHFPEADEDVAAYSVGGHRHLPEMVQELSRLASSEVRLTFTPHLVPMSRGMLLTIYAKPKTDVGPHELRTSLQRCYEAEPFVHVLPEGKWPHSKWATGTNICFIAIGTDEATGRAILVSALDNLGKGYAGQMVQCLNLMMGVDESCGIALRAAYP